MAATLVLAVSTSTGPTVTDSVAGIDMISADNATNIFAAGDLVTVATNAATTVWAVALPSVSFLMSSCTAFFSSSKTFLPFFGSSVESSSQ